MTRLNPELENQEATAAIVGYMRNDSQWRPVPFATSQQDVFTVQPVLITIRENSARRSVDRWR
jgi:hypothetical protein